MRTAYRLLPLLFAGSAFVMLPVATAIAQTETEPTNDLPNPYRSIAPWGTLPDGKTWGAMSGVAIDETLRARRCARCTSAALRRPARR